ncbi:MAG: hypothetical protein ABR563_13975, partial [Pyrinomonadaceae bacterium]
TAAAMREELRRAATEADTNDDAATVLATNAATPTPDAATRAASEQETQLLGATPAQQTVRASSAAPTEAQAQPNRQSASSQFRRQAGRFREAMARFRAQAQSNKQTVSSPSSSSSSSAPAGRAGISGKSSSLSPSKQHGETTVVADARRGSKAKVAAVVAIVVALCGATGAFVYNFARRTPQGAVESAAPQPTQQPAPGQSNANAPGPTSSPTQTQSASQPSPQASVQRQPTPRHNPLAPPETSQANEATRAAESQPPHNARPADRRDATTAPPVVPPVPPDDELASPNAPPPRGVRLPPGVDWAALRPAQRKRFVRLMRQQIMAEQRRIYEQQRDPNRQRRRQPPPDTPPPQP